MYCQQVLDFWTPLGQNYKIWQVYIYAQLSKTLNDQQNCSFAGWKSLDSVPKLVEHYMQGICKVDEFITHTMPLDRINEAFDLMHSGERYSQLCICMYVLVCWSIWQQ